ncbi:outer membrane beta-barrel protein [Mariniflexile aquimaris]|uniref:Outer membrane beta-barrel protein n=1 Tax=Mariniflexile aquimaris TaxID=881009 RepID=A0ABW3BNJ9_9FLAO
MKKLKIMILVLLLACLKVSAQVKDISVTFSPALEYTFWDDYAGLEDGLLLGGKVGFGFGEYIELRATYMQALDLKTDFSDFGLANYSSDLFTSRDVKLTRIGGEFKANFGTKSMLNPYFTLGSGVQNIQLESQDKHEQIFASVGLGAKFNIGKRTVFAIEAKNTVYNFNAGSRLLTDVDKTTFSVTDADFTDEQLSNWSAMASLQFYLGGREPGTLTELDRAYLKSFSSGFSGIRLVLEPGLANIKFDDNSNFRDAWMLGGYLGFDFTDYIGVRGFYYQATKNEEISTDFEDLNMYGGEFRARLNQPNGVVPFISLGGGYLNTSSDYLGKNGNVVSGSYFASGGVGLNVPLVKGVMAYGSIKALLTSNTNEEDLQTPDQIQTHMMYDFGLKMVLGKKAESPRNVYNENLNTVLYEQQLANDAKISNLKAEYKTKIARLETDLKEAKANNDIEKAVEILEDKKATTEALKEVEAVQVAATKKSVESNKQATEKQVVAEKQVAVVKQVEAEKKIAGADNLGPVAVVKKQQVVEQEPLVQMTPLEFEMLIQRILNQVEYNQSAPTDLKYQPQDKKDEQIQFLRQRVEDLEKMILQTNTNTLKYNLKAGEVQPSVERYPSDNMSQLILNKLDELDRKIESNTEKIEKLPSENKADNVIIAPIEAKGELLEMEKNADSLSTGNLREDDAIRDVSKLTYRDVSAFAGIMFGNDTMPVGGVRVYFGNETSKILFVPEVFFAVSNPVSFGLSGNGILPFNINNSVVKPYAGAGIGFINIEGNAKVNANLIIGADTNLLNGKLFVDFTTRNFFDYNQIAVGYKFNL